MVVLVIVKEIEIVIATETATVIVIIRVLVIGIVLVIITVTAIAKAIVLVIAGAVVGSHHFWVVTSGILTSFRATRAFQRKFQEVCMFAARKRFLDAWSNEPNFVRD